jgi:hypothetical protein
MIKAKPAFALTQLTHDPKAAPFRGEKPEALQNKITQNVKRNDMSSASIRSTVI